MKNQGVRVVVVTEQEHHLLCHILEAGLKLGWLANGHTVKLLERLRGARAAPTRRKSAQWLSRWWTPPA